MSNIAILAFSYVSLSLILCIYGSRSDLSCLKSYLYAIGLNVFPLIYSGYLGNESTRIMRIPIAYLPFLACFICSIFRSKGKILKKEQKAFAVYCFLLFYLLIQSFVINAIQDYSSFFQYYMMWAMNIFNVFSVSVIVRRVELKEIINLLELFVLIIFFSALVGIFKYLIGLQNDANFMPMMNRNGTSFLVVIAVSIILFLIETKHVTYASFICSVLVFFVCIVLMQSRMGILGFCTAFIAHGFYRWRSRIASQLMLVVIFVSVLTIILRLPIGELARERFIRTGYTVKALYSQEELDPTVGDYARVQLLKYGMQIIERNFIFGTGVGLENYRAKLRELNPIRESKPHNFYVSYLAEFGFVGFSILMLLLISIWMRLSKISISKEMSDTFKAHCLTVIAMLFMNEYITFPFIWFIWGVGVGLSYKCECSWGASNRTNLAWAKLTKSAKGGWKAGVLSAVVRGKKA